MLLSGRVTGGSITALNGGDSGSVLSADVQYTGGAIFDALQASGGATTGSLSWSILDATSLLDGSPSITINPATGFLVPFSANATGLFSVSVRRTDDRRGNGRQQLWVCWRGDQRRVNGISRIPLAAAVIYAKRGPLFSALCICQPKRVASWRLMGFIDRVPRGNRNRWEENRKHQEG